MNPISYDFSIKLPSLRALQAGFIEVFDSNVTKKTYQKKASSKQQYLIGILGYKKTGKTFLLGQLLYQSIDAYCPTLNISIKKFSRDHKEIFIFDEPGEIYDINEEIAMKAEDLTVSRLSQHFIDNYIIKTVSAVFLILSEGKDKYQKNLDKLQRVKELTPQKPLIVFHNCSKITIKENFRDKIIEIQEIYGLKDQQIKKMEDKIKIPYYSRDQETHLFLLDNKSEFGSTRNNPYMIDFALGLVWEEAKPSRLDFADSFNSFFSNNHKLYFESENDLFPDNELFSFSGSKLLLNKEFDDYFKNLRKPPFYDERGNLCLPKSFFEKFIKKDKKQEDYEIVLPRWKNLKVSLKNFLNEQFLMILGTKLTRSDALNSKHEETKKNSCNLDNSQEKDIRLGKLIKVSKEINTYSLKKESVSYLNGILFLTLLPFNSKLSKREEFGQQEIIKGIQEVFQSYDTVNKEEILILEEVELRLDHKLFRAFYEPKRLNVLLKIYEVGDLEQAKVLHTEFELMNLVEKAKSEYLIKFYGAFIFLDSSKKKKLDESNEDPKKYILKICALFETYSITLRQRLDIQQYDDQKILYIFLDLVQGLMDLENKKLPVGKINPKNIGLYPQVEKLNNKTVYKYKFFDYSSTDHDAKKLCHSVGNPNNRFSFSSLIKAMRKKGKINKNAGSFSLTTEVEMKSEEEKNSMKPEEDVKKSMKSNTEIEEIIEQIEMKKEFSYSEIYDLLISKPMLIETPIEETVIHHIGDSFLEEIDTLKSIFKPNPFASVEVGIDTISRQTLVKRNMVVDRMFPNANLEDLRSSMTIRKDKVYDSLSPNKKEKNIDMIELETLGEGGCCKVCKYFDRALDKYIAIKIFCPSEGLIFTTEDTENITKELQILYFIEKLTKPDYFLKFYGIFEEIEQKKQSLKMKMENGICNMREIVVERAKSNEGEKKRDYTQNEILAILIDILSALDILQKNGIANRDIKPDNFILIREDNVFKYKLTDFGIGIKLLENSSNLVYFATIQGFSKDFASPEVLEYALESRDFEENEQYDPFLADVYSLGVTVLFMMGMSLQFINEVRKLKSEDLVNSLQVFFKEGKYDLICEILGDMLHKDPTKRKTFLQIREMVESKANNVMIQQPEETNIVNKIEKCRKENTNSFAYVENCIKFARLYYSIGDMEEAGHYAKEANDKVELCNSCYDMEILRLRGLIFREAGDYGRAEKFSHRYHQILEIYKEKTHYIHDQKKSLQKNWSEVFQRLDKDEKADFLKMFWKFHS